MQKGKTVEEDDDEEEDEEDLFSGESSCNGRLWFHFNFYDHGEDSPLLILIVSYANVPDKNLQRKKPEGDQQTTFIGYHMDYFSMIWDFDLRLSVLCGVPRTLNPTPGRLCSSLAKSNNQLKIARSFTRNLELA
ncbi:hypothetical protein RUM44_002396 [Polyplax serrata]|uniref:Uncharacterized protein n=1 Tax=Polyplax serrata TaxID=468196 RepID=A0ABR1AEM6_POLSC